MTSIEAIWESADELGPARICLIRSPGLRAAVVVDNVAIGPAIGGTRMAPDVSVEEVARLARAMTLKNAAAGLPHGGAKSGIVADPSMPLPDKETLIRAFARAIEHIVEYVPGPDMGTDEQCMAWVHDEIGRAVGLPAVLGGIPLDEIGATGYGLAVCAEALEKAGMLRVDGSRVAIQGYGSVGRHAARFLAERGAVVVAVSDSRGAVADASGVDLDALDALKAAGRAVIDLAGASLVEDLVAVECDVWIPAARPDVITVANQSRLRAKVVLEGANIPASVDAERMLHERGVVVVPDFIANAGGVICAAVEYRGGTQTDAFRAIEDKILPNTLQTLDSSRSLGVPPRDAAGRMALSRVAEAQRYRRLS